MPDAVDDARQLISSRLAEVEAEATRLERALAGLGEGTDGGRHRRRRPPGRATVAKRRPSPVRKPGGTERAARGQRRQQLLAAIKAAPGARPSELAETIGIRPTQAHALIAKARAEKLIVKDGKGYRLRS